MTIVYNIIDGNNFIKNFIILFIAKGYYLLHLLFFNNDDHIGPNVVPCGIPFVDFWF